MNTKMLSLSQKRLVISAHDDRVIDLLEWVEEYNHLLSQCHLYTPLFIGNLLERELPHARITKVWSRTGLTYQELTARMVKDRVDGLILFWPARQVQMRNHPSVRALTLTATVWKIPIALNRTMATGMLNALLAAPDDLLYPVGK